MQHNQDKLQVMNFVYTKSVHFRTKLARIFKEVKDKFTGYLDAKVRAGKITTEQSKIYFQNIQDLFKNDHQPLIELVFVYMYTSDFSKIQDKLEELQLIDHD